MKMNESIRSMLELETPTIVVDRPVLDRNIARAAEIARTAGVVLRPHVKTHKSVAIAGLQVASGAVGLTTAKPSEASIFLENGFRDIMVAHPLVDSRKIARLIEVAQRTGGKLRLIADSMFGVAALGVAAADGRVILDVMVKVDVGLHRCGVDPAGRDALDLAQAIDAHPALTFAGIISHAGHAYSVDGPEAVRAVAEAERRTMLAVAERIRHAGLPVPVVSVGSTPTVWLGEHFDGITEIRPGNSVFMDLTQVSLGVASRKDISLSVIATVVSVNDRFAIVDAGSKVLSSDRGPHGSTRMNGYGIATRFAVPSDELSVASLSEEHGFLAHDGRRIEVGERVRIWPNHACTVVNLARSLIIMTSDGKFEAWPVDARARVE